MKTPSNKIYFQRLLVSTMLTFSSMRILCLGMLLVSMGTSVAATQADCGKERMAVTQTFTSSLPANPNLVNNALRLQREGDSLCQQGEIEAGRAKLKKAAESLKPDYAIDNLANPQGERHE